RNHPPDRYVLVMLAAQIVTQRGRDSGLDSLIDAHGPGQRMSGDGRDGALGPQYKPSLRATEQFVTGRRHDVDSRSDALAQRRLVRQPILLRLHQAAAADILDQEQAMDVSELRQF